MRSSGSLAAPARQRPLAIVSAPGSRGDVNPMIAIGRQLRRRGFDCVISLAEPYAPLAEAAGLLPQCLISQADFDRLLGRADVWKPLSGLRTILQQAAIEFLEPHFELIRRVRRPGQTVLVAHPLDFASRIHRDLDPSTPLVDVLLSPAMVRDPAHPPRLTPWWFEPRRPAWLVALAYRLGDHLLLDRYLGPGINRLRRRLGLPPQRQIMDRWWLSPDLVLSLYPNWFGPVRPPCRGAWHACGFPLRVHDDVPADPDRWTTELFGMRPGAAAAGPIFFTPGTAHRHARDFFQAALQCCHLTGRSGILATTHDEHLPRHLPANVRPVGYLPLHQVLPACSAIVHHGGVGTTAQALAAGCPQLITPMAFDQFHHGLRVEQLGVGRALQRLHPRRLTELVTALLDDPGYRARCAQVAKPLGDAVDGAEVAAQRIAALVDP